MGKYFCIFLAVVDIIIHNTIKIINATEIRIESNLPFSIK